MLTLDSPAILARFDAICGQVASLGLGITLTQLGVAHALARELEQPAPDAKRVHDLEQELGLACVETTLTEEPR